MRLKSDWANQAATLAAAGCCRSQAVSSLPIPSLIFGIAAVEYVASRLLGGQRFLKLAQDLARAQRELFGGVRNLNGIVRGADDDGQCLQVFRPVLQPRRLFKEMAPTPVEKRLVRQRQAFPGRQDHLPAGVPDVAEVAAGGGQARRCRRC